MITITGTGLPKLPSMVHPTTGVILTAGDLPCAKGRWTAERKSVVLLAIRNGLLTQEQACARYSFSESELAIMQTLYDKSGLRGLCTTKLESRLAPESVMPVIEDMPDTITVGDVVLDRKSKQVAVGERHLRFSSQPLRLLEFLMHYAGQVVTREMLMVYVYDSRGHERPESKKIVEIFICNIHKKLRGDDKSRTYIEGVWGRGYRFIRPKDPE